MDNKPNQESLLKFPCDFHIKMIGKQSDVLVGEVLEIMRKHFPNTEEAHIHQRPSQKGRFLALSIKLYVLDQSTLDALYLELTKHPDMKWVL
ncbi:MAG: DUF493 domain-containing protein [Legionellales bacterium]|nr:DUF493 domain-containing protein [Legionellales bacterium]